jgi:undecaprenyl-diphosphatase
LLGDADEGGEASEGTHERTGGSLSAHWLATAVLGALVVAASVLAARGPAIPHWEQRVFAAINGLPGWLYVPLWPVMQLGNLVVGTAAGLVVALVVGDGRVALGVLLAMVGKLVTERLFRKAIHGHLPARQRPGTSQPHAELRGGDVPSSGASFPSGHVLLVAAVACVVAPVIPAGWELVPLLLALLVPVGRIFVGAHNPLDTTCGFGLGLVLGGVVSAFA